MQEAEKKTAEPANEKESANPVIKKYSHSGKTPKQIMTKHIRDKNYVITEEDFRNMNISTDITSDKARQPLEIPVNKEQLETPANKERPKNEHKNRLLATPWDLIS